VNHCKHLSEDALFYLYINCILLQSQLQIRLKVPSRYILIVLFFYFCFFRGFACKKKTAFSFLAIYTYIYLLNNLYFDNQIIKDAQFFQPFLQKSSTLYLVYTIKIKKVMRKEGCKHIAYLAIEYSVKKSKSIQNR